MFNSETYVKNIITNNIQQVSGSLIKTDPNSFFISLSKDSRYKNSVFWYEPEIEIKVGGSWVSKRITVLQVMLSHDNSYICEVVLNE